MDFVATETGEYKIRVHLFASDGEGPYLGMGLAWVRVKPYEAIYLEHNTPSVMVPNEWDALDFTIRNNGYENWPANQTWLGYRWYLEGNDNPVEEIPCASTLLADLPWGDSESFSPILVAPDNPGLYNLHWDMVMGSCDNPTWFQDLGSQPLEVSVLIASDSVYLPIALENHTTLASLPSPTPTPSCVEGSDLIQNGGFETGRPAPLWVETSNDPDYELVEDSWPHSGDWGLWLGGRDDAEEEIYQSVTLPTGIESATIRFYLYVHTEETSPYYDYDKLYIDLKNNIGESILPQPFMVTNRFEHQDFWVLVEYTIYGLDGGWGGQTIRLSFADTTDYSNVTHFFIDDVEFITHCQ